MAQIPIISFLKNRAKQGDQKKREELMSRILSALKQAEFKEEDIQQFLIEAFEDICKGKDANKSLLLQGEVSGKFSKRDYCEIIEIGQEVFNRHNTLIQRKTKNRKGKTPLKECIKAVCEKYNIAHDTAHDYYKEYKKYREIIAEIN